MSVLFCVALDKLPSVHMQSKFFQVFFVLKVEDFIPVSSASTLLKMENIRLY